MGSLYETICNLCKEKEVSGYRLCKDIGIQPSILTDLKSGRKKGLSADTAQKIADYFGVTVGFLLGNDERTAPASAETRVATDDDIKFALFGGDAEIPDEVYEDVKRYAAFLKEKYKANL